MLVTTAFLSFPGAMQFYLPVWLPMLLNSAFSFSLRILVRLDCSVFAGRQSNPFLDIERFYGQRKPIAKRIPIVTKPKSVDVTPNRLSTNDSAPPRNLESPTPALTECETDLDTEFDDETVLSFHEADHRGFSEHRKTLSADSVTSSNGDIKVLQTLGSKKTASRPRTRPFSSRRIKAVSQHDLLNKYFKRDAVILRNVDLLRFVSSTRFRNLI